MEVTSGAWKVRSKQVLLLVRPTVRTIRWLALAGGAVAAQLAIWAAKSELSREAPVPLMPLRMTAVLLCLGAAFTLDDDAGATLEPSVASLVVRRGTRLALALPALGAAWGGTLWAASRLAASGVERTSIVPRSLPVTALTLEAAAMLAVTLAAAAVGTRWLGHGKGGVAAGPTLLGFVVMMISIQPYWPLFPNAPVEPGWAAAHARWALVLALAMIVLAVFSLDPARRPWTLHRAHRAGTRGRVRSASHAPVGGKP
jgi:hypothetical protein